MSDHILPFPHVGTFFTEHVEAWCDGHRSTRDALARKLGMHPSWVSRLCGGLSRPDPRLPAVLALMQELRLSLADRREALTLLGLPADAYMGGVE